MSDDPINIVVTDGVDPNIATKLNAIADASDKSSSNLDRLKAALAGIRGDNLTTLKEQATSVTQAINNELNATKNLATTNVDAANKAASLATETKNATTAADSNTAAINKQTAATKALKDEQSRSIRINTTPTALGASGTAQAALSYEQQVANTTAARAAAAEGAAAMAGLGAASKEASAAVKTTEKAVAEVASAAPGLFSRFKTAGVGAFDAVRDAVTNNGSLFRAAAKDIEVGAVAAGEGIAKMGAHSINTSTAMRELLVLAREGGRGDFSRMAGSASILAGALGLLPIALSAAALGFGLLYAERSKLNTDAEQTKEKAYAESLGLTEKEMRKLTNTTVDANGKIQEHNVLQITYGDTLNGLWATVKQGLEGLFSPLAALGPATTSVVQFIGAGLRAVFVGFYAFVHTGMDIVGTIIEDLAKSVVNTALFIANGAIMAVQGLINAVISGVNLLISGANKLSNAAGFGNVGTEIGKVDLGVKSLSQNMQTLSRPNEWDNFKQHAREADNTLKGIGKTWDENTIKANRSRIADAATAIRANRNAPRPKKESEADPKTQADYLYEENAKLDNQIKLFGMLKDARDVQQQLNQIEEAFIKRRMPLDAAQLAGFKAKIETIQMNNKVQAQMDSIYQSINGPQQTFTVGQAALTKLLAQGNISLTAYNQQLVILQRAFIDSTDPLAKMNEELDNQAKAIGLTADETERFNNAEKIRQALLAKGIILGKNATPEQTANAAATLKKANANDDKTYVSGQVNAITDPMLADKKFIANKRAMYAQIDDMRKRDVLSESQASQAKRAVDAKYNEIKLQGAEQMFDALAGLSSSKNKILAGIGKAAAVADATIKGFQAVQNAYANVPVPFNIPAAAAMAVLTGVQVAGIVSTNTDVGSYWTGGDFIVNGKTGVDANRISMAVSDGERVTVQTKAQQQANANDNSKAAPQGATHVYNLFDEREFVSAMDSPHGDKVIMNIISRNKNKVNGTLKS